MNGRPWTDQHTDLLLRLAGRVTDEVIAALTGHCRETVTRRRLALGLDACGRLPDGERRLEAA